MATAMAAGLGLASAAWATPARAPESSLQVFVLASAPDSLTDLEAHAHDVGVVYPTYFECEPGTGAIAGEGGDEGGAGGGEGAGEGSGAEAGAITAYTRARGIAVMPRFNCQDGPTVHTILTEPRARARTLAGLVQIASNPAYAGVNLDLENDIAADRNALTSFVQTLARLLHAHGKRLAVDVDGVTHDNPAIATGFYDDRALAAAADYVFVIAWGTHWEGSAPGPIAPLSYVSAVARYVASLPHGNRFVLGAPMYGLDWPVPAASSRRQRASALQYANVLSLAHATGASPVLDRSVDEPTFAYTRAGVTHRVWYMDAQSVADRLRIAREHGLAVGVWRLGGEDQALWSSPPVVEGPLG
jgi:spore germination protein YaaH